MQNQQEMETELEMVPEQQLAHSTGILAGKSKTTCVSCIWGQDAKCTSQRSMCPKALSNMSHQKAIDHPITPPV